MAHCCMVLEKSENMSELSENMTVRKVRRSRPEPDAWVNVCLPSALRAALERDAVDEDRSLSAQVRYTLAVGRETLARRQGRGA